jgi:hypothetical protein
MNLGIDGLELVWILKFGIWIFRPPGTGLFLKVVRKDPFIFRTYYLEAHFAIGTEDEIPWPLISLKGDIGITDRTFQFFRHGWPPSSLIEVLLFEIEEKIKSQNSSISFQAGTIEAG